MITKLKIRYYGEECLRLKSSEIEGFDASHQFLLKSMLKTMYENEGIGLAAPQVGINERFFIADIGEGPVVVLNPIVKKAKGEVEMEEGCLSVPGVYIKVKRPKSIVVKYQDFENNTVEATLTDMMARVFLHEMDHLDGITIVDHAPEKQKEKIQKQVQDAISKITSNDSP